MAVHFLEEEAETTEAMVPAMVENNESGQGGAEKKPETDGDIIYEDGDE